MFLGCGEGFREKGWKKIGKKRECNEKALRGNLRPVFSPSIAFRLSDPHS